MHRKFETELNELKDKILRMGGVVEAAIEVATQALIQRNPDGFKTVHSYEREINKAHLDIDESCLKLLALQAPLAADLRLVLAIVKINTDLERMGDQSVNIAYSGEHYLKKIPVKSEVNLPEMAFQVRQMVKDSLDAFVRGNVEAAESVLKKDDAVDKNKYEVFKKMKAEMQANPESVPSCLDMILITRNLERLADHATNIAEDVIFIFTGRDVRHGGVRSSEDPTGTNAKSGG